MSHDHHQYQDLIKLFNANFSDSHNTRLVKGNDEPLYSPASSDCSYHQIIFAHGFYSSALHEISHWCIAGSRRRLLEDFGYWYQPDGRNETEQKAFEQVEVKPQAVEWAFCVAANKKFTVSADNLNGFQSNTQSFEAAVYQQVLHYIDVGFPAQAQTFIVTLCQFYQTTYPLSAEQFALKRSYYE